MEQIDPSKIDAVLFALAGIIALAMILIADRVHTRAMHPADRSAIRSAATRWALVAIVFFVSWIIVKLFYGAALGMTGATFFIVFAYYSFVYAKKMLNPAYAAG